MTHNKKQIAPVLFSLAAFGSVGCGSASPTPAPQEPAVVANNPATPVRAQVFTSDEKSFHVTSTVLLGEHDAVLVDAQFTLSEARRLADEIAATGKELKTVLITHAHPDHWFGLEVIKERFPNADIVAEREVVDQMREMGPKKLAYWKPILKDDLTSAPVLPRPIDADHLELEGQRLDLISLEPGEIEHATVVFVPSSRTLVAGDVAYNGVHAWLAEADAARRTSWLRNIQKLKQLGASTVVAGHKAVGRADSPAVLDQTAAYVRDFDTVVASTKSATDAERAMLAKHSDDALPIILKLASEAALPPSK